MTSGVNTFCPHWLQGPERVDLASLHTYAWTGTPSVYDGRILDLLISRLTARVGW